MRSLWQWQVLPVRLVSAAVPILFIAAGFLFADSFTHWTFLILVATVFGYVHFIIATTYQIKGIVRSPHRNLLLRWFCILILLGALVSGSLILAGFTLILAIITIAYFVMHVLANEHTFLSREVAFPVPYWAMLSLVVPLGALYSVSLLHPSLFFNHYLIFSSVDIATRTAILGQYLPVDLLEPLTYLALVVFGIGVPTILFFAYRLPVSALLFLLTAIISTATVYVFGELVFMYVLHFVLVYHFVLLSLLFVKPMASRGWSVLREYLLLHVVLLVPLLIAAYFFMTQLSVRNGFDYLFYFEVFLAVSLIHITASLLNEPWFKNWVLK
jgi:hypothetical protein